jgi:type IX secretion system PorP/SprF family membrane protein
MLLTIESIKAQGITNFDIYQYDLKIINPAFAGLEKGYEINTFLQQKKVTSSMCSFEQNISKLNSGIGLIYQKNETRAFYERNLKALYNYQYVLKENKKISLGMSLNYESIGIDKNASSMALSYISEPGNVTFLSWDLGAVYDSNTIFGGISIENISRERIKGDELAKSVKGFNATIGYKINNLGMFDLRPMLFFQEFDGITYFDINLQTEFKKLIIAGARYSSKYKSLSFNAGINWKNTVRLIGKVFSNSNSVSEKDYEVALLMNI